MIRVRITEGEEGCILSATGHAGYAPYGQDIVCAGVSALLYGLVSYLRASLPIATAGESYGAGERSSLRVQEGDGMLAVEVNAPRPLCREALDVTVAGLGMMAAAYPAYVILENNRKGDEYEPN
jgi:uncharacterized protein YsxB (DUF464 family)